MPLRDERRVPRTSPKQVHFYDKHVILCHFTQPRTSCCRGNLQPSRRHCGVIKDGKDFVLDAAHHSTWELMSYQQCATKQHFPVA